MSKLDQPLRLKHGIAAAMAALALGVAGTAIPMATAGGGGGGLHYVRDSRPVIANSQATEVVHCPAGTRLVGGGAEGTAFFSGGSGQMLNTSAPFDDSDQNGKPDDGWIGTIDNFQNADNDRLIVHAICRG
jgi:hypothetical protein